eukprot:Clim_evm8s37 gene=Clim_evmTU8s37
MASSRGNNRGRGYRARGRGGKPGNDPPEVQLSKTMSYILRHGAAKEGIPISEDGWVKVENLQGYLQLRLKRFVDFAAIREAVETNDKQRFSLKEDGTDEWYIRANQGHSARVTVAVDMEQVTDAGDVPVVVHGTYQRIWEAIKKTGLSRMRRQHIHMAVGLPPGEGTDVVSGMRSNCNLVIYIDVAKAMDAGITFFRSANNVILSGGNAEGYIPPDFFLMVKKRNPSTNELLEEDLLLHDV